MSKALVVLSGGQDSTTCLFWAKHKFQQIHAITFDYGQRHRVELDAARKVAELAGVTSHEILQIPEILNSTSPLTSAANLEQYTSYEQMEATIGDRVELTFVPMRNALFLTIAANHAVAKNISVLVTGVCEQDNANYPDCRASFISAQKEAINQALGRTDFDIQTPLIDCSKAQSIHLAKSLPGCMEALAYSHTAYDGAYPPTGRDHATVLRERGFLEAGEPDPLVVRAYKEGLMELPPTPNYDAVRR